MWWKSWKLGLNEIFVVRCIDICRQINNVSSIDKLKILGVLLAVSKPLAFLSTYVGDHLQKVT